MVAITECPRDAMQGIARFIPTEVKAKYIQLLLQVGFDRLDFGSFVSPKAIPQLRDTAAVLDQIDTTGSATELLAIIANVRGAQDAVQFSQIGILGFPFSVSETFQLRNTNSTIVQALESTRQIADLCFEHGKKPLVYLSMGFGNPYGDEWSEAIVADYAGQLVDMGIRHLALADTVGTSDVPKIQTLYPYLRQQFPDVELGLHLHSIPEETADKLQAAVDAGCRRFDTAIGGLGGCPMAADRLTGNVPTEALLSLAEERGLSTNLDAAAWGEALAYSREVFQG